MNSVTKFTAGTLDKFAKLLATEDIIVEHDINAPTACFDVQTRVLTLPVWKVMPEYLYHMMVLHEVGHALYTPLKEWKDNAGKNSTKHMLLNIIEDARIERKMKTKYPGSRRDFSEGYRFMYEQDFFKIKNMKLDELSFADRLNIHYKLGFILNVPFKNDEELEFVERIDNTMTFDDVIDIGKDIYEYANSKKSSSNDGKGKKVKSSIKSSDDSLENDSVYSFPENDDDDFDYDDGDNEDDDNEDFIKDENAHVNGGTPQDISGESPEPKTEENTEILKSITIDNLEQEFSKKFLNDNAYTLNNAYYNLVEPIDSMEYVETYKHILSVLNPLNKSFDRYNKFIKTNAKIVSYMVKEFEMKKSADEYIRSRSAKTGVINSTQLHSYKFNDDIFRRMTIMPETKNHGMFMIVDFSGSMANVIKNTIDQLLNLVLFCRKTGIPHRVYAFQSSYKEGYSEKHKTRFALQNTSENDKQISPCNRLVLMELFHEKMRNTEFREMSQHLLSFGNNFRNGYNINASVYVNSIFGLESTPLNSSLLVARNLLRNFRKETSAQIINLITLTDGHSEIINSGYQYSFKTKNILRDNKTKLQKNVRSALDETDLLLSIIRKEMNITCINFYIADKYSFKKYRKGSKTKTYEILPEDEGYNVRYILKGDSLQVEETKLESIKTDDMTKGKLARTFININSKRTISRVLLSKFISRIAAA